MPDIETIKEKLIKDPDFEAKIGQTKEETAEQEATQRVSQHNKNATALAMATQPSNSVTDLNDYLKEKQKRREVDEMIYGPPTEEIREKMDRQLKVIDVDVNTLTVMRPPSNTSTQVKDELNQIIDKHYQSKAETENFELEVSKPAELQDLDILKSFIKLAEELGLADDITKNKLKSLRSDAATIILNMKYKFNRPRPVQLMDYHGVEFKPADFKTSNTPSYPSGHAFQGTLIAMVLSEIFPQHAEEFIKLGESIGDNRVVFGVHYPSDHYAGIELAKQVFPHVNFSSLDFKPIVEASPPESQPIEKAKDVFLSKLDATDITMIATGLAAAAIPLYTLVKVGILPKISGDKKEEVEKVIEDKKEDLQKETVEIENGEIHNPTKEEVEDIIENIENKSASDITNEVKKTRKTRWDAGLNKQDAAKIRAERKAKKTSTTLPKIGEGLPKKDLPNLPEGAVDFDDLNDEEFKEIVANLPKYELWGRKLTGKEYEKWKEQKKEIEERSIQQDTEMFGKEKGEETRNYFKDQQIKRDRRDRRRAIGLKNWDRKEDDPETMPDWRERMDGLSDEDLEKLKRERFAMAEIPTGSVDFDDVSDEEFKEITEKMPKSKVVDMSPLVDKPKKEEETEKKPEEEKEKVEEEEKVKEEEKVEEKPKVTKKPKKEKVEEKPEEEKKPEEAKSEKKKTPLPPIGEGLDTPKIEALINQAEESGLLDHIHEEIEGHGKENPFHEKEHTVEAMKEKYDTEAKMREYLGKQHGKFETFKTKQAEIKQKEETKQAETKQKEEAKQQKLEDKAKADADPNKKRWDVKDASPDEAYDSAKEMISHSLAHSEEHGGKGLDEKSVKHMNTQLSVARKLMGSKNIDKLNNELKNDEIKPAELDDEKVKEDYEGSDIPPEARGYGPAPEDLRVYTGPEGGQFYDKREAKKQTGDGTGETKTGEDGKVEKLPEPSIPKEDQVSTDEPVGDKASSWGDKIGSAVSALGRFAGKEGKEDRSKLISEASKYLKETADIMGPTFAGSLARNLARSRGYGEAQAQNAKLKNQLQAVARGIPIAGKIIPASENYRREALAGLKGAQAEERAKQRAAEDKLNYGNKVDFEVKKSDTKNLQDFLKKRV